ncbi:sugar transferase [Gaiella sp.]|uniref:sugar transferase n=1 Tax=Gaiella sp. TaxID=2663207 RepID=UPI002E381A0F|nr:sugar transferase [Gaiella sp.]HEX5585178.1 sugar transferase [Gaiella sp.]
MIETSPTGNAGATSSASEPVVLPPAKRALDVAVSASLLVGLAPVWAVVLGAMGLDMLRCPRDRGRLLYRERRISRGRPFDLLKLRTLRESVLAEAAGHVRPFEADAGNLTWAGRRVLKPLYLDELPQLVNVLRGEMSLVGPRPWPPELVERQLARGVDYRLRVTAGWTGPAQMSKGRDVEYESLDRAYLTLLETRPARDVVRHDLRILRRTLATMLRGEGLRY